MMNIKFPTACIRRYAMGRLNQPDALVIAGGRRRPLGCHTHDAFSSLGAPLHSIETKQNYIHLEQIIETITCLGTSL
eukprot:312118-Amphidinium_carterae.1